MSPSKRLPVENTRFYATVDVLRKELCRFIGRESNCIQVIHGWGKIQRNSLRRLVKQATKTYRMQIYSIIDRLLAEGYLKLNPSEAVDTHVDNTTLYNINVKKYFECYGTEKAQEALNAFSLIVKERIDTLKREREQVTQKQRTLIDLI